MLTPGGSVRKVSIIPRGMALGGDFSAPDADASTPQAGDAREDQGRPRRPRRRGARLQQISTGAESDIDQLTALARQMVGRWGMSDALGPISVIRAMGRDPSSRRRGGGAGDQKLLDDEVRRIVAAAQDEVVTLLTKSRAATRSRSALLEHETLDEDDAYPAAGVASPRPGRRTCRCGALEDVAGAARALLGTPCSAAQVTCSAAQVSAKSAISSRPT